MGPARVAGVALMAAAALMMGVLALTVDDVFWVPAAATAVAAVTALLLLRPLAEPAVEVSAGTHPRWELRVSVSEILLLGVVVIPAVSVAVEAVTGNGTLAWVLGFAVEAAALAAIHLARSGRATRSGKC